MKTAIVTGATSGIGLETARGLLQKGYWVTMTVRNVDKAELVKKEFLKENPEYQVSIIKCDLADLDSVVNFAEKYIDEHKSLDLLVNNAGLITMSGREETKDGLELMMGTTHFGHMLLTDRLIGLLEKSEDGRIVTVSSTAHRLAKLDLEDINAVKNFSSFTIYANSKLANILFTKKLSKLLQDTNIKTYAVHPGVINSGFFKNQKNIIFKILGRLLGLFIKSPVQGAENNLFIATDKSIENDSGEYYENKKIADVIDIANQEDFINSFWDKCIEILEDKGYKIANLN